MPDQIVNKPTAERIRHVFCYDPETGIFTSRNPNTNRVKRGQVLGSLNNMGYYACMLDSKRYLLHRLAWVYVYGYWPMFLDHIDGCPTNNRIANLREVTQSVNLQNQRRPRSDNKCGFLGVFEVKRGKLPTFVATITVSGKLKHIGTYRTPEAAHAAYLEAKRRLHEGCTI